MSDEFSTGRGKTWNIYSSSSNPSPSTNKDDAPWKSFDSSMNAISFGFVATAILVSMFLIMALFEHLFRPNAPSSEEDDRSGNNNGLESRHVMQKLANQETMQTTPDFSVVMPGDKYPTFIAQPAPLQTCQREGVHWPSHQT